MLSYFFDGLVGEIGFGQYFSGLPIDSPRSVTIPDSTPKTCIEGRRTAEPIENAYLIAPGPISDSTVVVLNAC